MNKDETETRAVPIAEDLYKAFHNDTVSDSDSSEFMIDKWA